MFIIHAPNVCRTADQTINISNGCSDALCFCFLSLTIYVQNRVNNKRVGTFEFNVIED